MSLEDVKFLLPPAKCGDAWHFYVPNTWEFLKQDYQYEASLGNIGGNLITKTMINVPWFVYPF